jgi:two-component system, LytTR family, sensor kinase
MSVKLTKNWIQTKKRQQLLEKEKLETELKFLKSQFNPHFLFNSINSIFVLIHKNPDMASESLAKFSDLLRYQLYECNEAQISLSQELTYIENFIELEKLRQEHNIELTIEMEQQHAGNLGIAPFILMPFIENAFKHVSKRKDETNWIRIHLHFDKQELHFNISNSVSSQYNSSNEPMRYKGIGLKNVQRRLELLYPQKHALTIQQTDEIFAVTLHLDLIEQKITEQQVHAMELSMA